MGPDLKKLFGLRKPPAGRKDSEVKPLAPASKSTEDGQPYRTITTFSGEGAQNLGSMTAGRDINLSNEDDPLIQSTTSLTHGKPDASRLDRGKPTLLDALKFDSMEMRENTIDFAHKRTCEWLFETPEYGLWQSSRDHGCENRLFWIRGKPGTGKSTLMRFAVDAARKRLGPVTEESDDEFILSHFFNARGSELEKTAEGLYRTLLCQLLTQFEYLSAAILRATNNSWKPAERASWPVRRLIELLSAAIKEARWGSSIFYIDALDECKDSEIRSIVKGFEDLIRNAAEANHCLRVCFASRHSVNVRVQNSLSLVLEDQEQHRADITIYIRDNLDIDDGPLADEICKEIEVRASGVFIWLKLVIDMLNEDYGSGHMGKMRERLKAVPSDLHQLYLEMVNRGNQDEDEFLRAIQILLVAHSRLHPAELWWQVQLGMGRKYDEISAEYNTMFLQKSVHESNLERWVVSASRGLMNCTRGPTLVKSIKGQLVVQFIHETVRAFVLSDSGLLERYGVWSQQALKMQSHRLSRDCCTQALEYHGVIIRPLLEEFSVETQYPELRIEERARVARSEHRLLEFAADAVLDHANLLQNNDDDQAAWLSDFDRRCGLSLGLLHQRWRQYLVPRKISLIEILILDGHDSLIRGTQLQAAREARAAGQPFGLVGVIWHNGVSGALKRGCVDAVHALVKIYLQLLHQLPGQIQAALERLARIWQPSTNFAWFPCPLLLDIMLCSEELATFFLIALAAPHDLVRVAAVKGSDLDRAIKSGFYSMFFFFLDHGIQVDGIGVTPEELRLWAIRRRERQIVLALKNRGLVGPDEYMRSQYLLSGTYGTPSARTSARATYGSASSRYSHDSRHSARTV